MSKLKSFSRACRSLPLLLCILLPTALLHAQEAVIQRYPAGSIGSVEAAERALAEVAQSRTEIEARFSKEERACYAKFFVTSCVDEAKDRRRVSLQRLKPIELEANLVNRRARVKERDEALADKRADEQRRLQADEQARREHAAAVEKGDAARAAKADADAQVSTKETAGPSARVVQHEEKLKRQQADDAAAAQERAANVAAYERKIQAVQARQREIAERKAEKAHERDAKQVPAAK